MRNTSIIIASILLTLSYFLAGGISPTFAQNQDEASQDRVYFEADEVSYEGEGEILLANGNVVIEQDGQRLTAQSVRYDKKRDVVAAEGDVVFEDRLGNTHKAKTLVLRNEMRDGVIKELRSTLKDEGWFWAEEGEREDQTITMKKARYSACEPCEESEKDGQNLPWQIKARQVIWDEEEKTIEYKDAKLEVEGVPVLYTPYFAHPDPTVKQKSGFLRPSVGFRSQLGFFYDQDYYWAIDDHQDATFGLIPTTSEGVVAKAGYRRNFGPAMFNIDGSITNSGYTDDVGGTDIPREDVRGHVFGDVLWSVNDNWRAGGELALASDDQYLRQYDFEHQDILTSQVFAERFGGRNYTRARAMSFQDLRINQFSNDNQPLITPMIESSFVGDQGKTFGGRWAWEGSALNLVRDGNGLDITRLSNQGEWRRRFNSDSGLISTMTASARADYFATRDIDPFNLDPTTNDNDTEFRFFPQLHMVSRLPMAKPIKNAQLILEPVAALTLAPNLGEEDAIPNEDSTDTQLDITNLFNANRFTGLDRIEDRSRATYGLKLGYLGDTGRHGEIFFGQSVRFSDADSPFETGSGLENQQSDYVGQIMVGDDDFRASYRVQADGRDLEVNRHEAAVRGDVGKTNIDLIYSYVDDVSNTGFTTAREQVFSQIEYDFNDQWTGRNRTIYDFSEGTEGLLRAGFGIDYNHDCYTLSFEVDRNLTDQSSGESETSFLFRLGLKNIGALDNGGD